MFENKWKIEHCENKCIKMTIPAETEEGEENAALDTIVKIKFY